MGRACTVCSHHNRAAIDEAIVRGEANRIITEKFGVSGSAVRRHRVSGHVLPTVVAVQEEQELLTVRELDRILQDGLVVLVELIQRGVRNEDDRLVVSALRELRGYVEQMRAIIGPDQTGASLVRDNPEWVSLRSTLIEALKSNPEARQAIVEVLGDGIEA